MFSTPKVLAARPNLQNGTHTFIWPEDNTQKDVDQVQICLKYNSPPCVLQACKKRKRKVVLKQLNPYGRRYVPNFLMCSVIA